MGFRLSPPICNLLRKIWWPAMPPGGESSRPSLMPAKSWELARPAIGTRRAVERTVPFGLICFCVVTVWYALHGHAPADVAGRRARARWYTTKTEPSYDDM